MNEDIVRRSARWAGTGVVLVGMPAFFLGHEATSALPLSYRAVAAAVMTVVGLLAVRHLFTERGRAEGSDTVVK